MSKLRNRVQPLLDKLAGRAPLCPWPAAASYLRPGTFRVVPPAKSIRTVESMDRRKCLEFGGRHRFWFPEGMEDSQELWSEYLVGFWDHPVNFHQYLRGGVTLEKGDVVIDCGACEGFFTRAALDAGVGKVICVEPSSVMAGCLRITFGPEIAAGRVVVAQVALGSFPGSARFASAEDDAFAGRFDEQGGEIVTLEQLAARHGRPTFIKMDLEGAEYQALAGGQAWLSEHRPKLGITTYHYPWDFAGISSFLRGVGYTAVKPYGVTYRNQSVARPVMVHAW
jgi:FkbM family methyltransferase